ncbi:hypothetical protein [Bradyrhizobium sp. STM 3843]|uniref:hypothetical protein n=1 Tax=Bradyrhizobium sp. STM 3843 TaxID=551947 RepID=UPI001586D8A1|nr:hypothetical protein [Bradyrhizobium sp. STM 3843]
MARLHQEKQAAVTTGAAETSRHPLRDGLHAYTQSPWCAGLFGHHIRAKQSSVASATTRLRALRWTPASGCQDAAISRPRHAVRPRVKDALRHISGHRLPASRAVTIAMRPSCEAGWRSQTRILKKRKTNISARDLEPGFHDEIARKIGFSARGVVRPWKGPNGSDGPRTRN